MRRGARRRRSRAGGRCGPAGAVGGAGRGGQMGRQDCEGKGGADEQTRLRGGLVVELNDEAT